MNLSDWNYLYNWDVDQWSRANLVYTPYVSPDKKTMCMSFNRDTSYHTDHEENAQWTDDMLTERFLRELTFHRVATDANIPTLTIQDVDLTSRKLFIEWHGDDFFMQGINKNGYDAVLSDWKSQWLARINEMWAAGIYKFSLHPNSWVVSNGQLIPWNWFFSFTKDEPNITIRSLLVQISLGRLEKLEIVLNSFGMNLDTPYDIKTLQKVCFHSFKTNYPEPLIAHVLKNHSISA